MKEYRLKISGREYNVAIDTLEGDKAYVRVNGHEYEVEISGGEKRRPLRRLNREGALHAGVAPVTVQAAHSLPKAGARTVTSPLPGTVISICVRDGQEVRRGQKVAVVEAMKMENEILSSCDGKVAYIHVSEGASVLEGAPIVTIG